MNRTIRPAGLRGAPPCPRRSAAPTARDVPAAVLLGAALVLGAAVLLPVASGCTPSREAIVAPVEADVRARLGRRITWRGGSEEEERAARAARAKLLEGTLRMDQAVQLALLENRFLQAAYEELGVSEAMLLSAGLLSNPVFHVGALFHAEGGAAPDLGFAVEQDFLSVLAIPARRAAAEGDLAAARARASRAVVDIAAMAREAFVDAVVAEEVTHLRGRAQQAAEAVLELTRRLHAAGNVNDLALVEQEAHAKEAAVARAGAARDAAVAKARLAGVLNVLDVELILPAALPDPHRAVAEENVEARVVERSLALAALRGEIEGEAARLGYASWSRFVPGIELGAELEREEGEWKGGPGLGITVPLFDQGQGTVLAAESRLRARAARLAAETAMVRARAREAVAVERIADEQHRALEELLPIHERIVEQTQLLYNGMFVSVFDLLAARVHAIDTAERRAQARRLAWRARIDVDRLLAGGAPGEVPDAMSGRAATSPGGRHGGH
jgi:outer membrane protein, heavy metal efflux system